MYRVTPEPSARLVAATAENSIHTAGGYYNQSGSWVPVGGNVTPVSTLLSGSVPDRLNTHLGQFGQNMNITRLHAGAPMQPRLPTTQEADAGFLQAFTALTTSSSRDLRNVVLTEGTFSSDEQRGRAVLISGIPTDFSQLALRTIFNVICLLLFA